MRRHAACDGCAPCANCCEGAGRRRAKYFRLARKCEAIFVESVAGASREPADVASESEREAAGQKAARRRYVHIGLIVCRCFTLLLFKSPEHLFKSSKGCPTNLASARFSQAMVMLQLSGVAGLQAILHARAATPAAGAPAAASNEPLARPIGGPIVPAPCQCKLMAMSFIAATSDRQHGHSMCMQPSRTVGAHRVVLWVRTRTVGT